MNYKDITVSQYVNLNQEWNLSNGDYLTGQVIMEPCKAKLNTK